MFKLLKRGILFVIPLLLFFSNNYTYPPFLQAQGPVGEIQNIPTTQITGQIIKVDGNRVTVRTFEGVKEVIISNSAGINRNSVGSRVEDLKPNDLVVITTRDSGEILSVDALSGGVIDFGKWVVPALFGGVILLLFMVWLFRKTKGKEHFRTTVSRAM